MKFTPNTAQPGPTSVPGEAPDSTPGSISAAATAFQLAMDHQTTTATTGTSSAADSPAPLAADMSKDVVMSDMVQTPVRDGVCPVPNLNRCSLTSRKLGFQMLIMSEQSPATPLIPRTGTPSRHLNGNGNDNSRAASLHPEPSAMPKEAPPHGAPTRQYINSKVTGPLLDGMKILAKEQYVLVLVEQILVE